MVIRQKSGFGLGDLLLCIVIVGILVAMYMAWPDKGANKASGVVVSEQNPQPQLDAQAGNATPAVPVSSYAVAPSPYRAAYRHKDGEIIYTQMSYVVRNEAEFRAYWFTLIDPASPANLQFDNIGNLIARDDAGVEYVLPKMELADRYGTFPVMWEFLSTNLAETSSGSSGTDVLYSDGHVEYVAYPGPYPACKSVAQLSHRFMEQGLGN